MAQSAGDLAGEALARHGLCETLYFTGPLDQALEEGRRADELFRGLGQRPMVYHNLYMVAWLLWLKGQIRESLEASSESVEGCRELGNRRDEGFALARSIEHVSAGDLGRALREMDEAIKIAEEIQTPRLELAARGIRVGLLAEVGRWSGIGTEIDACIALADRMRTNFARSRLSASAAWLALRNGDAVGAEGLFQKGRELTGGILLDVMWNLWIEMLAYDEAGQEEKLRAAAESLADAARDESPLFEWWGTYGRAAAAALRRDWKEAAELGAAVESAARSMGERSLEWRGGRICWKALAALGRNWDAMVEAARAGSILREMAETIEEQELRDSFLSRPDVAEVLSAHKGWLFGDLTPEELEAIRSVGTVAKKEAGEVIFRRGDPGSALYVVDRGIVRIVLRSGSGEERVLAELGPGEALGEVALIDGQDRTADAVAAADCVLIELPRDEFLRLLAEHAGVAERLMAVLADRASDDEAAARDGFPDIPARVARAIQSLAEREGRAEASIEILPVFVREGRIRYLRPAAGSSLQIGSGGSRHPNQAVVAALGKHGMVPKAVHSTSWRYERGRLVLTYLAVLDGAVQAPEGLQTMDVRRADLARGSATGAPDSIEIDSVVEHALRHLAWLIRDDPAIQSVLEDRWAASLATYEPEPFRSLGQFETAGE